MKFSKTWNYNFTKSHELSKSFNMNLYVEEANWQQKFWIKGELTWIGLS